MAFLPQRAQRPQRLCERCVRILCELCVERRSTGCFNAKNAEATQRTQRIFTAFAPTRFDCRSDITILAMDEILLRIEISGIGEEGTWRRTSERACRAISFRDRSGRMAATCCDRAPSTCTPLHGRFLNRSIRNRNMAFFAITSAKTAKALRTLRQNSLRTLR